MEGGSQITLQIECSEGIPADYFANAHRDVYLVTSRIITIGRIARWNYSTICTVVDTFAHTADLQSAARWWKSMENELKTFLAPQRVLGSPWKCQKSNHKISKHTFSRSKYFRMHPSQIFCLGGAVGSFHCFSHFSQQFSRRKSAENNQTCIFMGGTWWEKTLFFRDLKICSFFQNVNNSSFRFRFSAASDFCLAMTIFTRGDGLMGDSVF